ncbi:MAG TPA: BA14K family protein [Mesorhizobium sp.]|jgi:hypothetical protein|nr:BA14K family protein [Mesorhizobium sp.]
MRRLLSSFGRALIAAALSLGVSAPLASAPAVAAPLVVPAAPAASSDVHVVRNHRNYQRRHYRRYRDGYRHRYRDSYRHRHYRRHRDRDSVIALGLGLGVLGALAARPRYYHDDYVYVAPKRRVYRSHGNAHVDWCYSRYRSYRAYDNTYQPYHGGRRQCWSPYS